MLAAAVNGLIPTGMGVYVFVEGVRRLFEPVDVQPGGMAAFAAIGLVGNLVGVALLYRARDASLNMRGAFLEVATVARPSTSSTVHEPSPSLGQSSCPLRCPSPDKARQEAQTQAT
ncbi:cation transporter [Micromonospora arborensis]|uniref:cation transporter n=1 Tax=Micromonospora arborensis TaxID=2116518 RepID=UPI001ABEF1A3|nr:cation transporter [Micromonospora arborensis]